MSAAGEIPADPDRELVEALWKLRDLIKSLDGPTLQRFTVDAGDYKIEIERAVPTAPGGPVATGAGPGPGVDPGRARRPASSTRSIPHSSTTGSRCSRRSSAPSTPLGAGR